jgi:chromodomain-helicase-DNA-binding protein 4
VPYYGEAKSREIVRRYELMHDETDTGYTKLKYHVLVTTYETITGSREFGTVFKQVPRWEALIVDEGQRRTCLVADQNFRF